MARADLGLDPSEILRELAVKYLDKAYVNLCGCDDEPVLTIADIVCDDVDDFMTCGGTVISVYPVFDDLDDDYERARIVFHVGATTYEDGVVTHVDGVDVLIFDGDDPVKKLSEVIDEYLD